MIPSIFAAAWRKHACSSACLAAIAALFFSGPSQAQVGAYEFSVLGTLGGTTSRPVAINASGQVVGLSYLVGDASYRATLWSGGTITDLGTLGGESVSYAHDINDSGKVLFSSFHIVSHVTQSALWTAGTVTRLNTLGGTTSEARAINASGQIVGVSDTAFGDYRARLWDGGAVNSLGTLAGGSFSMANGINDSGQVVGASNTSSGDLHATLWNGNAITDLGTLAGGTRSFARQINNSGQVIGSSATSGASDFRATLWSGGTVTDLGAVDGRTYSWANDINAAGQVVGYSSGRAIQVATLWNGTTAIDLNSFLADSTKGAGWVLSEAFAINDSGQIVGQAYNSLTGDKPAFMLTPVPEPEAYLMLGIGIAAAVFRSRKRSKR